MMQLDPRWREILRRAWSVRLMLAAGLLSALEGLLTLYPDMLHLPRPVLALAVPLVICAAFIARVVAQKGL